MDRTQWGILILAVIIVIVVSGCDSQSKPSDAVVEKPKVTKEEPKEEPKPEPKEEKFVPYQEKVCITINGKEKCRTITKHKKHEGTKIKK